MATYQVPVWFNIEAENSDDAWLSIAARMLMAEDLAKQMGHPVYDYTVEEPTYIEEEN